MHKDFEYEDVDSDGDPVIKVTDEGAELLKFVTRWLDLRGGYDGAPVYLSNPNLQMKKKWYRNF